MSRSNTSPRGSASTRSETPAAAPAWWSPEKFRVTTVDEDRQEVLIDEPASGEFFGFASIPAQ